MKLKNRILIWSAIIFLAVPALCYSAAGDYKITNDGTAYSYSAVTKTNPINVKHPSYGAKGDGATNDTAAINAASAALTTNSTLYFPNGHYMLTGVWGIIDKSNITIEGESKEGTIIDSSGTATLSAPGALCPQGAYGTLTIDSSSNTTNGYVHDITLKNITIKSSISNPGTIQQKTIFIGYVSDFRMENCVIYGGYNEAVHHFQYSGKYNTNLTFRNNKFIGQSGIGGSQLNTNTSRTTTVNVENNTFWQSPTIGIHLSSLDNHVIGNRLYGPMQVGILFGDGVGCGYPTEVLGNKIYNLGQGSGLSGIKGISWVGEANENGVLIEGNLIYGLYKGATAISISGNAFIKGNMISSVMDATGNNYGIVISEPGSGSLSGENMQIYLSANIIEKTANVNKFASGIQVQQSSNIPNATVYLSGNIIDDSTIAVGAGGASYQAKIVTVSPNVCNNEVDLYDATISTLNWNGNSNALGDIPLSFNNLQKSDHLKASDYIIKTLAVNSATPSVAGFSFLLTANTNPTTITNFTNGITGQVLHLLVGDSNTTLKNNTTIQTSTGADKALTNGLLYELIYDGSKWHEKA